MHPNVISLILYVTHCMHDTYVVFSHCKLLVTASGPEVIKVFSCPTQLSMKSKLLTNIKIAKSNEILRF